MEPNNGKPLSGPQNSDQYTNSTNGSHDVTLDSIQQNMLKNPQDLNEALSTDYHLTAEIPNSSLTQRDLSLLLDVLNYQISNFGCNFSMYIGLCELYFRVKGNCLTSMEVSIPKIRLTLLVSEILIGAFKETSYSLYSGEFVLISAQLKELLSPYLMSRRTYGSRYRTYRPEKFIRIKAVPVNRLIDRPQFRTERYSGYTKGYGESHGNAHRKKTKPSIELDGSDRPDKVERNLELRMIDQEHQKPNSLWIKFRNLFWKD
jgi:hypothetical protein